MAHPGQPSDAVSAACPGSSPGVSSWWDMLETPPQGGCQGASDTDALATSAGSSLCGGAASGSTPSTFLVRELLTLSLRECPFTLQAGFLVFGQYSKFMTIGEGGNED